MCSCEDINFAKLAIRYSQNLNKDTVFHCVRAALSRAGAEMAKGGEVNAGERDGTQKHRKGGREGPFGDTASKVGAQTGP